MSRPAGDRRASQTEDGGRGDLARPVRSLSAIARATLWRRDRAGARSRLRRRRSREPPQRSWLAAWWSGLAAVRLRFCGPRTLLSRDPIDPDTLDKGRFQIEFETFAHDPGKEATHRMRLPASCFCQRRHWRATG